MATTMTKIVLDADVIIHFAKGELLSILPDIFPEYKFVVLDIVYNEGNLKDITDYCEKYNITYLTTIDFLYYGIIKKIITKEQAEEFITKVTGKGSKLPKVDFSTYICSKI